MNSSLRVIMAEQRPKPNKPKPRNPSDGLFADAAKVKKLRKPITRLGMDNEPLDGPLQDELVAEHEWASLLHAFDTEADELAHGAGSVAEEEDLWERLSTTRWLKNETRPGGSKEIS